MGSLQRASCIYGKRCGFDLESGLQAHVQGLPPQDFHPAGGELGQTSTRDTCKDKGTVHHNASVLSTCVRGRACSHCGGGNSLGAVLWTLPRVDHSHNALFPQGSVETGEALVEARVIFLGR